MKENLKTNRVLQLLDKKLEDDRQVVLDHLGERIEHSIQHLRTDLRIYNHARQAEGANSLETEKPLFLNDVEVKLKRDILGVK